MPHFTCVTCATQFAESERPPARCPVCVDERQYVRPSGQQWTTTDAWRADHAVTLAPQGELTGVRVSPKIGIGQRALLVPFGDSNVMWDCVGLVDDAVVGEIERRGGLRGIAISHPHYYSAMVEWAHRFDCPVWLHAADARWIMRSDPALEMWEGGSHALGEGLTLHRIGGHFPGQTLLHQAAGCGGRGTLLTGDMPLATPDNRWVSFMWSYPNRIPLPADEVRRIAARLDEIPYATMHTAFWDDEVADGPGAVRRSAERQIAATRVVPDEPEPVCAW